MLQSLPLTYPYNPLVPEILKKTNKLLSAFCYISWWSGISSFAKATLTQPDRGRGRQLALFCRLWAAFVGSSSSAPSLPLHNCRDLCNNRGYRKGDRGWGPVMMTKVPCLALGPGRGKFNFRIKMSKKRKIMKCQKTENAVGAQKKNENRKTRMQPLLPTPRCTFPRSLNATLSLRLRQQRRPCVLSSSVNKRAAAEARKHFHTRIDQTQTRQRVMATGGGLGERRASGEGVQLPSAAF